MSYITDQKHDPAHPRGAASNGYVFDFACRAALVGTLGRGGQVVSGVWPR